MDSSPAGVAALALAVTLVAVAFQFADAGTAWYDTRRARSGRVRLNPAAWVVPLVAIVVVCAAIASDAAARLFQSGDLVAATVVAAGTAAALVTSWMVTMRGVFRRTPEAYARLRDELLATGDAKLPKERLDRFRERLLAADRARPSSKVTVRRLLFGRPWRFLPVGIAIASFVLAVVSGVVAFVVAAVVLVVVSMVFLIVGARAAVAARLAWRGVADDERGQVVLLLEDAEARSAKRNPGLGDRVNRALQILREQQS